MKTLVGMIIGFMVLGPIGLVLGAMIANDPFTGSTMHSD